MWAGFAAVDADAVMDRPSLYELAHIDRDRYTIVAVDLTVDGPTIVSSQPQRQGLRAGQDVVSNTCSRADYRELSARRRGELPNG
jgi:hypothetical protein